MIDLETKTKRHEYMIKRLRMLIAYQVRLLRIQRGWTQKELAGRCKTKQPAIALVENWDKEFPSVNTLKSLAEAFDCALVVRFDGWEDVIRSVVMSGEVELGPDPLEVKVEDLK